MMKKMMMAAVAALMLQGCGMTNPGVNGGSQMGGTTTNNSGSSIGSNALGGLLDLVVGSVKLSQADIIGTWSYVEPACAFTSENLLAKAGGSVAAKTVNEKLLPVYNSLHISSGNTRLTFNENGQFTGTIGGFPMSGTYTFDAARRTLQRGALGLAETLPAIAQSASAAYASTKAQNRQEKSRPKESDNKKSNHQGLSLIHI